MEEIKGVREDFKTKMDLVIYGAKSFALGICHAMRNLYPEHTIQCFLVSSKQGNPLTLAGLPVKEIGSYVCEANTNPVHVLIGTPEDTHLEIIDKLKKNGLNQYTCMDSKLRNSLMERYFLKSGKFPSVHMLHCDSKEDKADLQVFMAKFHRDRCLSKVYEMPPWVEFLQVGAALTEECIADFRDNTGEHISGKNVNYCELTALYWMWKNKLDCRVCMDQAEYYGLFHYRRILDISERDLKRIKENDVDVVLPFPTIHEPDIREHPVRYVKESDWDAMRQALWESEPKYERDFERILEQPYLYNYNLIVAKRKVLSDYCAWLFPILERTEELSQPKGWERKDRYVGYLGESLLTLYFLLHQENLKIFHTGCCMLM